MRSITAALVALVLVLGVAACGGSNDAASTTTDTTTTSTETETDTTGTGTDTTEAESPTVVHVTVTNGVPSGGIVRQSVNEGDSVVHRRRLGRLGRDSRPRLRHQEGRDRGGHRAHPVHGGHPRSLRDRARKQGDADR